MNKAIAAIIAITILSGFALYLGIDGVLISVVIGALAGLGGFEIGKHLKPK